MDTAAALGGLSSSCQAALPRLLTSSFATCADIFGLVSLASASGSVVPALDNYIGDLCTTTPCTAADLTGASNIITQGCTSDINNGSLIPTALQLVIDNFDGVRSLLCTQETASASYCVPQVLYAAQNASGTQFSLSTLSGLASDTNAAQTLLAAIPKEAYCTDCGEAITIEAINIIQNSNTSASGNDSATTVRQAAGNQCGAGFAANETLPAGITTVGENSTTSSVSSNSKSTGAAGTAFSTKHAVVFGTIAATLVSAMVAIV